MKSRFSPQHRRNRKAARYRFQRLCDGVVVRVEEFPDDETLREMGFDSPFDLLGLFRGIGLAQDGASPTTGQFPNMIWLYRRPILDYWAEHEETLGPLVTHVLVHEIGHKRRYGRASAHALYVDLRLARRLVVALRLRTIRNAASRCTLLSQYRHSVGCRINGLAK